MSGVRVLLDGFYSSLWVKLCGSGSFVICRSPCSGAPAYDKVLS